MAPKTSGEVWKPRAIRHVERVERQAAVQPAAEPTVEPGPSAPAEGLRTDDLDELDAPSAGRGDDLDLPTKRQKVDDTAAVDEPVIKAEVAAAKERGESLEDEVIAGAPRLAQHIKSAAKCIKVAAMAYSLLEQGAVTSRSSGAFFEVVDAAMEEPMRPIVEPKYRVAYRKLFEGLLKRKHAFSTEQQQRIDEWQFQLTTSLELVQADDSFAFSRAAKKVPAPQILTPSCTPPLRTRDHATRAARCSGAAACAQAMHFSEHPPRARCPPLCFGLPSFRSSSGSTGSSQT